MARDVRPRSAMDPVDLEVLKHRYLGVAEDMGSTLRRTGFSPNIKERLDYSCAVYDSQGETIAQGDHMPVHLGAMPLSVRAAIEALPMARGDMVVLNDPFRGGTHLPDLTLVAPVYLARDRRPSFYVANRAHHADVGGMRPGSMPVAEEIYQEGLILPPVHLVKRDRVARDIWSLILANVRTPDEREGDLSAQIAANRVGIRRVLELVDAVGRARSLAAARALQHYTARVMAATIARIPPGTYVFEDVLDEDGCGSGAIVIRAAVTIAGEQARVDFTGSAPQVRGSVNANEAITRSACAYVFRCLIEDDDVLYNAGIGWQIEVIAPRGTVVNANRPAAVAGGNVETSQRITDVVFGALASAIPDRVPAASQGTMNNITLGGRDPFRTQPFAYYETLGGGMGARAGLDGLSGVHTHMSNTRNTPIEALEQVLPLRITQYRLREGSGGAGRWKGGDGLVREYEARSRISVTVLSDRRLRPPYGARGGAPGAPGRNTVIRQGVEQPLPGKAEFVLEAGDRVRIETPGGGGFGGAA